MYSEVTRAIAGQVKVVLSPAAEAAMAIHREVDPKAYENYLYGIYWLNASASYDLDGDIGKAKKYFDAALAIDSTYAAAWAGLAEVYVMSYHGSTYPENVEELCYSALDRALELDPNVSDAYRTKAHLLWEHVWDMEGGEEAMNRGLELNPSDAYLTLIKAIYSMCTGQLEEGAHAAQRAAELDPMSFKTNVLTWWPVAAAGWKDEAIAHIEHMTTKFPEQYGNGTIHKARAYALCGDYESAIDMFEKGISEVTKERLRNNQEFDRIGGCTKSW